MDLLGVYLLVILLAPLVGFVLNGLLYPYLSKVMSSWIACVSILVSFVGVALSLSVLAHTSQPLYQCAYFKFLSLKNLDVSFSLMIDKLNALYLLIITFVSLLIHIYSAAYMHEDKAIGKYFAYLNLFVFSMLLLVLGANYLILFIGWEGVGLCSFLLIGFWHENKTYTYAARKAFVMNRIGDLCLIIAMFLLLIHFQTLDYRLLQDRNIHTASSSTLHWIAILLFIGAIGKSAQFPLYTWLPDAMAGPTPVSALIHAATMVTAGVFLIARSSFVFEITPLVQQVILFVGLFTAFLAATVACVQNDIKKVLAYSTVSQLGFMFVSLGVGNYEGAIFHVLTHAFFKALLFLGAGSVIHAMSGTQDMREMGGLKKSLPITHLTFLIACLAISGIPGFSGFFSKDNILMSVYATSPVCYVVILCVALLTVFYMFRLYCMTFLGTFRGTKAQQGHIHESPFLMTIPLLILAFLSIVGGYVDVPTLLGGSSRLGAYLSDIVPINEIHLSVSTEILLMLSTFIFTVVVIFFVKNKYQKISPTNKEVKKSALVTFLENKWYMDELYDFLFVKPLAKASAFLYEFVERRVIDAAVDGFGKMVLFCGKEIRLLQTGKVGAYVFGMLLGMILLLLFLI